MPCSRIPGLSRWCCHHYGKQGSHYFCTGLIVHWAPRAMSTQLRKTQTSIRLCSASALFICMCFALFPEEKYHRQKMLSWISDSWTLSSPSLLSFHLSLNLNPHHDSCRMPMEMGSDSQPPISISTPPRTTTPDAQFSSSFSSSSSSPFFLSF